MDMLSPHKRYQGNYVATVGFFDGVHLGHRFVIRRLKAISEERALPSLLITFARHPRRVLSPDYSPALLTTLQEKLDLFSQTGVDTCVVLDFTSALSRLTAAAFMEQVLKHQLGVEVLLMGYDHRFGCDYDQSFANYVTRGRQVGIEVLIQEQYSAPEAEHISSSAIRRALSAGEVERANLMLGYSYSLESTVTKGYGIGRTLGFPTANLLPVDKEKLLPAPGVYAVRAQVGKRSFPAMLNIGTRPTLLDNGHTSIEVHLIGFSGNLYSQTIRVSFVRRIRSERKFDSMNELARQLETDRATAVAACSEQET